MTTEPARVPVRTILATIGLVLATGLAVLFVIQVQRVLVWMLVAGFFTITLYPVVAWVQRRLSWCPRWLATLLVFLLVFLLLGGLLALFAVPRPLRPTPRLVFTSGRDRRCPVRSAQLRYGHTPCPSSRHAGTLQA